MVFVVCALRCNHYHYLAFLVVSLTVPTEGSTNKLTGILLSSPETTNKRTKTTAHGPLWGQKATISSIIELETLYVLRIASTNY